MGFQEYSKGIVKTALAAANLELRRLPRANAHTALVEPPPPLHEDVLAALHDNRGGKRSAFQCPLDKVIDRGGFGFGKDQWHPFVTVLQLRESQGDAAAEAFLDSYYARHQPRNAAEAFIGFSDVPEKYQDLEPYLYYLVPWEGRTSREMTRIIENWTKRDNVEHKAPDMDLRNDGFPIFGPASDAKRHLEFNRLRDVADSLKINGYDRSLGDCCFCVIKRDDDYRFIPTGGGYHRTAAMAALGHDWITGRIFPAPFMIDTADVDYWPQVRQGVWTRCQALAYIDYLFDYNSRDWYLQNMLT
jgi:hypothetical protein